MLMRKTDLRFISIRMMDLKWNEVGELSCSLLEGYSTNNFDCDDDIGTINPNVDEICDGIDNDCDDNTDENDAIDRSVWFIDEDNDGFGSSEGTMVSCSQPVDYEQNANDCDDDIDTVNPNADEICDGIDNDCDGLDDMDEDVLDDNKIWTQTVMDMAMMSDIRMFYPEGYNLRRGL